MYVRNMKIRLWKFLTTSKIFSNRGRGPQVYYGTVCSTSVQVLTFVLRVRPIHTEINQSRRLSGLFMALIEPLPSFAVVRFDRFDLMTHMKADLIRGSQ